MIIYPMPPEELDNKTLALQIINIAQILLDANLPRQKSCRYVKWVLKSKKNYLRLFKTSGKK